MKTKLSSIFGNWINAIKKFPVSHLIVLFVTIVACRGVHKRNVFTLETERLYIVGIVAFVLSLFGPLWFEKSGNSKKEKIINISAQIFSLVLGLIYYLCIRNVDLDRMSVSASLTYLGPIILAFALLFLLIAIRYRDDERLAVKSYMNIFWGVVVGGLVGLIVRGGVSGAIRSFKELIYNPARDMRKIHGYLGCLSLILLATSFGLNYYLVRSANEEVKPTWINKVFGTYIFLPLTLLYLAIFVLYGLKILITGVWPKGVLVGLGFGYFALGIIAIFLTYLQEDKKFKLLHKTIFGSFLLIAILMICAIYMRVHQYGFTINRYLVCAGIFAIIVISALALCFEHKRFVSFFAILAGITLVSIYGGPIGAKQVSLRSQLKGLNELLQTENIQLPLKKDSLHGLQGTGINNIARALEDISYDYSDEDWKIGIIDEDGMKFNSYDLTYDYLGYEYSYENDNDNRFIRGIYEKGWYRPSLDISEYKKMYPMGGGYYNSVYSSDDNVFDITIENEVVHLDLSPYGDMIYNFATKNNDTEHPMIFEIGDKTYVFTYAEGFKHDDGKIVLIEVGGFVFLK